MRLIKKNWIFLWFLKYFFRERVNWCLLNYTICIIQNMSLFINFHISIKLLQRKVEMTSVEIKKMASVDGDGDDGGDIFLEDPFDTDMDLTFPPMRYYPMPHYPNPPQKKASIRR